MSAPKTFTDLQRDAEALFTTNGTGAISGAAVKTFMDDLLIAMKQQGVQMVSFKKTFADFKPQSGSNQSIVIGNVPKGAVIVNYKMKLNAYFQDVGSDIADGSITLTFGPDANAIANINAVSGDPISNTLGATGSAPQSSIIPNQEAASDLALLMNLGKKASIDSLTAGEIEVWVWYVVGETIS